MINQVLLQELEHKNSYDQSSFVTGVGSQELV